MARYGTWIAARFRSHIFAEVSQKILDDPPDFDSGADISFQSVSAYAMRLWGELPGVGLIALTAAAGGLRPFIEKLPPAEWVSDGELDVLELAREIGLALVERIDCGFAQRMVLGRPDDDIALFLQICAALQLRVTFVPITDSEWRGTQHKVDSDLSEDDVVHPRTWGDVVESLPDAAVDLSERIEEVDLHRQLSMLLVKLPSKQERVLRLRFGVGIVGAKEHTLFEIGRILGVTRERARQIERRALRGLALPAWHSGLDAYLFPTVFASAARRVRRPSRLLLDAIEVEAARRAREEAVEVENESRVLARRERARAEDGKARAASWYVERERQTGAALAAWRVRKDVKHAVQKAEQDETVAEKTLQQLLSVATEHPDRALTVREQARIDAAKAWLEVKKAERQVKADVMNSAMQTFMDAKQAARKANREAKFAEAEAQEALRRAADLQAMAERAEKEAKLALGQEASEILAIAKQVERKTAEEKAAVEAARAAVKQARKEAKRAERETRQAERAAAKQAEREAKAAAKKATQEAARAAKAAEEKAFREAARAAAKLAEKESRRAERVAAKQAEREAKAAAKKAARRAKAADEMAARAARAAARQREKEAQWAERIAAKQAEREAKAAAKKATQEAARRAKAAEEKAARVAAKQAERDAKRAEREARKTERIVVREAQARAKRAARLEAQRTSKAKKAAKEAAAARKAAHEGRIRSVSVDEFAGAASVPRRIVLQIVRHGYLEVTEPAGMIARGVANRFLQKFVSIQEIRQRWPGGERFCKILGLAKVPPVFPVREVGMAFYSRPYVNRLYETMSDST